MNQRRTTLADVAKQAGVHVTTVSLALRNHQRLPPATRERLQTLAKKMGYSPDPFLQALVAYRAKAKPRRNPPTLAYVTNWHTCFGWKEVTAHPLFYRGALAKATELGFKLDHFWAGEPVINHTRLSDQLDDRNIKGIVAASHVRATDRLHLDWSRFSAVKIDYFPHEPALHNVTNNQSGIVRLAMRRVIAAGYRRIGFVMHRGWDWNVDRAWTAGFLCEQASLVAAERIPIFFFSDSEPIAPSMARFKSSFAASPGSFAHWFKKYRPEVIISKESFVAPCFKDLGLRVPRDVRFVDVFLEHFDGRTAGVRQNHEMVGRLAVEILAGQLHHKIYGAPEIPTTTHVDGTWFDGASCPPRDART